VTTLIAAALEDGIGIILLANADSKEIPISNIILKASEKVFGYADPSSSSPPANQSAVSRRSKLPRNHAGVTARADDGAGAGAPLSDVDLTGTYCNAGYGAHVLCGVHSTSPSCGSVLDAFRAIDPSLSPNSNSTDLFASWNTPLTTHARFTYANGSEYSIYVGTIYPEGYGKNTTAFSTLVPIGTAEFVVEKETVVGFVWNDVSDNPAELEGTSRFVKQA
jgi:hypothetical protein